MDRSCPHQYTTRGEDFFAPPRCLYAVRSRFEQNETKRYGGADAPDGDKKEDDGQYVSHRAFWGALMTVEAQVRQTHRDYAAAKQLPHGDGV